jgi:hypothetical protein
MQTRVLPSFPLHEENKAMVSGEQKQISEVVMQRCSHDAKDSDSGILEYD